MNTKTYISQLNLIKLSSGEDVFEKRQMLTRRINCPIHFCPVSFSHSAAYSSGGPISRL